MMMSIASISFQSSLPFPSNRQLLIPFFLSASNNISDSACICLDELPLAMIIKSAIEVLPFKFIDFRNFYSKPIYKLSPDLAASKIISKNAVINESNTKIKPLIVSGDSINVIFQNSTIDVYAKGKALNDANIGDSVKVKIKGKIYEGKVDKNANVIIR